MMTIFTISLFVLLTPIYAYLIMKWHKLHHHFVIRNRFPRVSIAVFTCSILAQLSGILGPLIYTPLFAVSQLLSGVTLGLVFHRPHMTYVRCTLNSKYLQAMTSIKDLDTNPTVRSDRSPLISYVLFVSVVIVIPTMILFVYALPRGSKSVLFSIQMVIGIFHTVRIVRSNVSESLDCVKESVISILVIIFMTVINPILETLLPKFLDVYSLSGCLCLHVVGLCALYIPIHLIHKVDKSKRGITLKRKVSHECSRFSDVVIENGTTIASATTSVALSSCKISTQTPSISPSTPTASPGLSVSITSHSDEIFTTYSDAAVAISAVNQPLKDFLQTQKHYQLFAGYLSECFALENLMFLERGIVLYHMIAKCKRLDSDSHQKESGETKTFHHTPYHLSFDYLPRMSGDMESIVHGAMELNTESDRMMYTRGIVKIMKLIYNGFCSHKSETQINTSYGVQHNLQLLLEDDDEAHLLSKFDHYDDLLNVFHEALLEIWDVCECVYDFQFKTYFKNASARGSVEK